jgi:prolyl oligopeptidase
MLARSSRLFDPDGKKLVDLALPAIGTVFGSAGKWDRDEVFYGFQSFTVASFGVSLRLGDRRNHALGQGGCAFDRSRGLPRRAGVVQLERRHARPHVRSPQKRTCRRMGDNPTLLTGYGGFNISNTPSFKPATYLWLEHGGVYAVANLRGGAEFGEDWHRAGMLANKQNVFDDMIAAAEHLIAEKYTDKNHLAIQGGSNGGLLMGAMITQRPDLFRAVVCQVPLLDMLHYQDFQIAKLWIPEYGSAENAEQFKWLYAYSPYHHVKAGVEYPATLFMTADTTRASTHAREKDGGADADFS